MTRPTPDQIATHVVAFASGAIITILAFFIFALLKFGGTA